MTATITRSYTLLGREFDYDELIDVAQYGCQAGVNGFIYSSELYDVWVSHGETIADYLEEFANSCFDKSWEAMIVDQLDCDDWTMQELKEKAIWCYLELRAQEETVDDL